MPKKIIITETQLNQILSEELGIAKEVAVASKQLKQDLFNHIEEKKEGVFHFLDLTIQYKVWEFKNEEEFYLWYDEHSDEYVNGYSFSAKTLYLTIICINGDYNVASLNDTIMHELEHYYQAKMAGRTFGNNNAYYNAYSNMNNFNAYISNISRIEYFSNHVEIDAFVNGAYNAATEMVIEDYNSFIEKTDLKLLKQNLVDAYNFFKSAEFKGIFFNEMLEFIKRNRYYHNCHNISKLRNDICKKCQEAYTYFVRKSSRAYALLQNKENELRQANSQMHFDKLKRYGG